MTSRENSECCDSTFERIAAASVAVGPISSFSMSALVEAVVGNGLEAASIARGVAGTFSQINQPIA